MPEIGQFHKASQDRLDTHPRSAQQALTDTRALVHPGVATAVLSAGGILVSLAQTLIVPLIVDLPRMFNTSVANASWIITVTLLAGAVATPVAGRLADMYGKKRILMVCLGAFVVGSAVSATSSSLIPMVIGRGLQGVASGLVPLGIALMHEILPKERAGKAIAFMSSSMGIGGALGLPLAAAVAQFASWRFLFAAVGVAALVVAAALAWLIPTIPVHRSGARFDILGALGLAAGLVPLLLAISKGSDWGWASLPTLGSMAGALLVLVLWGVYQSKRDEPLINLRTAVIPAVLITNLASILFGFTMYAMNLLVPPVMQLPVETGYGLGQSMVTMGLWMMPLGIGMMAVANLGAAISRNRGPRVTLIIAGLVIAAGYGATAAILGTLGNRTAGPADHTEILITLILLAAASVLVGTGIGLAFGAVPTLIISVVPASETAAANGVNALMRSLGTTSASAVLGVLLATMVHSLSGSQIPTLNAYIFGLLLTTGLALIASFLSALIPTRK